MYDPSRPSHPGTERQRAARDRNWRIFKLRGLFYQMFILTGERREAAWAALDAELVALGAEGEHARRERQHRELMERLHREAADRVRYQKFRAALVAGLPVHPGGYEYE